MDADDAGRVVRVAAVDGDPLAAVADGGRDLGPDWQAHDFSVLGGKGIMACKSLWRKGSRRWRIILVQAGLLARVGA